jgi:hypothetical protein
LVVVTRHRAQEGVAVVEARDAAGQRGEWVLARRDEFDRRAS